MMTIIAGLQKIKNEWELLQQTSEQVHYGMV